MDRKTFYEWIGERCYVSLRVAGNVARLWISYERFCLQAGVTAEKLAFTQAIATEFSVNGGLAAGVCLLVDSTAFGKAYPEQWRQSAVTTHRLRRKAQDSPIDHPGIESPALGRSVRMEAA
ncbi:hypothetical protein [Terriglobus aquaticus]|uniref:Uncharacterized protein n=1 Tax=Terriglobus aquaticus TaxID=940139 RepID=A0ABW9KHE3_9BACT|nr:hypothetical protein [Terriglobus aquaticus]